MGDIGNRLRQLRKQKGLTQNELAERAKCSFQKISSYENERNLAQIYDFKNICNILDADINYLINGREYKGKDSNIVDRQIISAYDKLSTSNKQIVDFILFGETQIHPTELDNIIYLPLVEQKASAGLGREENDLSNLSDTIPFYREKVPNGATHAIVIEGVSMQPTFYNGQVVFIKYGQKCNDGDYGIFNVTIDGELKTYCKQLKVNEKGEYYLHSINEDAGDPEFIWIEDISIICIGKILM